MAKIVAIHGINQEYSGSNQIKAEWLPALKDGLDRVGASLESDDDLYCGFYGDFFRAGDTLGVDSIPAYSEVDVSTDWEKEILLQWWTEAANVEADIESPAELTDTLFATPAIVQQALRALSRSKYFGGVAEKVIIYYLKQVRKYLYDPKMREAIKQRVADSIQDDTQILIGHSLGSIACYESLCEHPEWPINVFISLGSPLGIQRLIFDRLIPAPINGVGQRPASIESWFNIADSGDVVALQKQLNPYFEGEVEDVLVDNGSDAHNAGRYLSAAATGAVIQEGLSL